MTQQAWIFDQKYRRCVCVNRPYAHGLPEYAFLQGIELFKAIETDAASPAISEAEIRSGFIIGSANDGTLFLNLANQGSVWVMYSDLFFQRIADHFADLTARWQLVMDLAEWDD